LNATILEGAAHRLHPIRLHILPKLKARDGGAPNPRSFR
jgi:hypothetical protein